jgi:tetratricopeptide (TPR) repeat protein
MDKKNPFKTATSAWQKTALVFLGLILSLLLLETGMRLGGFIFLSVQESGNSQSLKQKGAYRILCLGESTTQGQYPHLLEQVLNQRNIGVRFSVIDKGQGGANTDFILSRIESYLAEYHPGMVVAMMGINDNGVKYYQGMPESDTWLFRHCRVYRFVRMHFMHMLEPTSSHLNGGRTSKSERSLKKGATFHPRNDMAYVESGRLYIAQGKFSQAEDAFKKAIEINPLNARAYIGLGRLYRKQGAFSQAEASFKKAIAIYPRSDKAYEGLGELYMNYGMLSQAEEALTKAFEINPGNEFTLIELGSLYRDQGELAQAENLFKKAIGINFEMGTERMNERILRALASLYEEMGKPELTKKYTEMAHQMGSEDNAAVTVKNYLTLKEILDRKGIKLVCVQYPMRNLASLKRIFEKDKNVIFVDNERLFKDAVKQSSYNDYFIDIFAGDFGHCNRKGNQLLAHNIADALLREVFNK